MQLHSYQPSAPWNWPWPCYFWFHLGPSFPASPNCWMGPGERDTDQSGQLSLPPHNLDTTLPELFPGDHFGTKDQTLVLCNSMTFLLNYRTPKRWKKGSRGDFRIMAPSLKGSTNQGRMLPVFIFACELLIIRRNPKLPAKLNLYLKNTLLSFPLASLMLTCLCPMFPGSHNCQEKGLQPYS